MSAAELGLRDDDISWTPADDGTVVILDLRTSHYLGMNESASMLWTLLSAGTTRPHLEHELREQFGVESSRATSDVNAFLAELRSREFLSEAD